MDLETITSFTRIEFPRAPPSDPIAEQKRKIARRQLVLAELKEEQNKLLAEAEKAHQAAEEVQKVMSRISSVHTEMSRAPAEVLSVYNRLIDKWNMLNGAVQRSIAAVTCSCTVP